MGCSHLDRSHVVRPCRDSGDRDAVHDPLRAARRAGEADARQRHDAEPGRILERLEGRPRLRVRPSPRGEVPQRRSRHDRRREILVRALPGRGGKAPERESRGRGGHGSRPGALSFEGALARFHDLLRKPGHRRGLDRAKEVSREGRRRGLQASAHRRRPVPVRLVHPGSRARAGRPRDVLEKEPERQASRAQVDPRRVHAPGHAQARRSRHRLPAPGRAGRRGAAHAGAHAEAHADRVDPLARVPRPVGPEVTVGGPARAPRRQPRDQPPGHQRGDHARLIRKGSTRETSGATPPPPR